METAARSDLESRRFARRARSSFRFRNEERSMRVHSGTWFLAATLAVVVGLNSPLPGAEPKDDSADGGAAADSGAKKASPPVGAKDPVALAFALPSGVVLNAKQKTAYEDLKQNNEADLRQAFDDLRQAKTAPRPRRPSRRSRSARPRFARVSRRFSRQATRPTRSPAAGPQVPARMSRNTVITAATILTAAATTIPTRIAGPPLRHGTARKVVTLQARASRPASPNRRQDQVRRSERASGGMLRVLPPLLTNEEKSRNLGGFPIWKLAKYRNDRPCNRGPARSSSCN